MRPSHTTGWRTAAGELPPGATGAQASPRQTRRQLAIKLAAASMAAPAMVSILTRATAAQDATPSAEQEQEQKQEQDKYCAKVMTGTPTATSAEATPTATGCVAIEMYDIYFEPNLVTIPADTAVTIALPNEGAILHNFSLDDHNNSELPIERIDVDVDPGGLKSVTVDLPAGEYYFYCNVPGHEAAGMFGYVVAEEGAEISAETATVTPPAG